MAETTIKFLSYAGLQQYDGLIKNYVDNAVETGIATSFKGVSLTTDGKLQFWTDLPFEGVEGVNPAYEITLPKEDLTPFMKLVEGAVEGNVASFGADGQVIDSGVKLADLATRAEVQEVADDLAEYKEANDAAVQKAQTDVDNLAALVGTLPDGTAATTVVEYVNKKTEGIATDAALAELQGQLEQAQKDIDAIEADYLVEADKTELSDAIDAEVERATGIEAGLRTDVDAVKADYLKAADKTELSDAIAAEAERAAGVEAGLDARLVEVETFFQTAEDETLDTALDTLVEIQKYLDGEGSVADQMLLDIAANKKSIEDHIATDHDFGAADEALKNELNAEIAKKADQTALDAEVERATAAEAKALSDANAYTDAEVLKDRNRLEALEAKFTGDASVENKIATAKQEAIDESKGYTDAEVAKDRERLVALEEASATHAKQTDLEKEIQDRADADAAIEAKIGTVTEGKTVVEMISDAQTAATYDDTEVKADIAENAEAIAAINNAETGILKQAKDHADGLNSAMNSRVEALELIDHEHANADVLNGITAEKVAAWDAAEDNAKAAVTELANGAVKTNTEAIAALTETHNTDKEALQAAIDANAEAIAAIEEIPQEDITALFA